MIQSDLTCINLETTITDSDDKTPKVFNFKLKTKYSDILKHVNFASIANNHIFDYKLDGFIDTKNELDKHNVKYAGAGIDLYEAIKPAIFKINNKKILIFSMADHYKKWESKVNKHGIWYVDIDNKE